VPDERPQDPILDEVRRNRGELLRASGGTVDSLFELLRQRQAEDPRGVVKLAPRRLDGAEPGAPGTDAA
jgi:hypothetical protein